MSSYRINIGEQTFQIKITKLEGSEAHLEVNGKPLTVTFEKELDSAEAEISSAPVTIAKPATATTPVSTPPKATQISATLGGVPVIAPIPGLVLEIKVKVGDSVEPDQTVVVMEAMKMENSIKSPVKGIVKEIRAQVGAGAATGDVLMVIG